MQQCCNHDYVMGNVSGEQKRKQCSLGKKHAYLIMAHTEFELLKRLAMALDDERADIYLHVDRRANDILIDQIRQVANRSNVYTIKRKKINWGGVLTNCL